MNQKLITVLFVSVFYFGVTYSSPLNLQNEGMGLPEEKPPTDLRPTTEHINKKIETSSPNISSSNQHINTSKVLNVSSQAVKEVTDPALIVKATEPHQRVVEEALNEHTNNKNKSIKISSESTADTPLPTSTVNHTALPTTTSTIAKSTTAVPATPTNIKHNATNTSANKTPTNTSSPESISTATRSPESISTTVTNATTTTSTTTATAATTTTVKPSITTSSPVSANKDNVVEHNTPAPVQEKHFDGQSFIGGMALTIGLTAIGFIAFKYYKSGKMDMNYRTL